MCNPIALSAIGEGTKGVGSLIAARGQWETDKFNERVLEFQEESTKQQAESQAASLDAQAKGETFKAIEAGRTGRFVTNRFRRQVQREVSQTTAALSVSGVETGTGSFARVIDSQERIGAVDAIVLEQNNALEVWGFRQRAKKFRAGANLTRHFGKIQARLFGRQAKFVGKAANLKAKISVLGGLGIIPRGSSSFNFNTLSSGNRGVGTSSAPEPDTLPAKG